MLRLLDALAFSSLWVASAAALLCAAASQAMRSPPSPEAVVLAFAGTLLVSSVDRVRDFERDRTGAPLRSAFVARHRVPLLAPQPERATRVALVLFTTLLANAVASSVRDAEAGPARIGLARGLAFARG